MHLLKTFAAGLCGISMALVGAAQAAPSLRADVIVNAPIVTVGDMFEDAGSFAELALFRAPLPGTTGTVDLRAVTRAAERVGLADFENVGIIVIRVTRAATTVDAPMLAELIRADMLRRGLVTPGVSVDLRFDRPDIAFNAEVVDAPARLLNLRYAPGSNAFVARFEIAGTDLPEDVTGQLELMVEAPHLVAPRPGGTILTADDIELRKVPLRYAETTGIVRLDQLVGRQLNRAGRGGLMLRAGDVVDPVIISRNQMVTVILKTGPMTLTVKGQALNAAAIGQPVQVLNPATRKILSGTALASGAVEMTTTLNVAGL